MVVVGVAGAVWSGKREKERKRKGRIFYIVPFILCIVSKRSDMDHTVL